MVNESGIDCPLVRCSWLSFILASLDLNFLQRSRDVSPDLRHPRGFIALMLWIYLSIVILLTGAEIDTAIAELNQA